MRLGRFFSFHLLLFRSFSNQLFALGEGLVRTTAHVAVIAVWPFVIVVMKPRVQIGLQLLDAGVELLPERLAEELVEDGAVETLDEAVCPGCGHLAQAMLDVV